MKFAFVPKDPNRKIGDQLEVHGEMMRVESFSHTGKNVVAVSLENAKTFKRIMCVCTENPPILGVTAHSGPAVTEIAAASDNLAKAQEDSAQEPDDFLPTGWKKEGYFYEFRSASGSKFTPTQIAKVVGGVVTK